MNLLKLAWRNVWRNSRRSSVTIAAMTIALLVELLYSGMMFGLVLGMEEDAVALDMGDIQVLTPNYATKLSLYEAVPDHEGIIAKVEAEGFRAAPRLFGGGLAASGEASSGVSFVGVDPIRDTDVLDLHQFVAEGQWLSDEQPLGVVIGRGLSRTLDVGLGSEIVVLSQGADGSVANELFVVRGILMSVAASTDRSAILMTERTFRDLMVFPQGAHKIIVRRPLGSDLATSADQVRSLLGLPSAAEYLAEKTAHRAAVNEAEVAGTAPPPAPSYPVAVKDWQQLNPFLAQYIQSVQGAIVIVYLIIYMAVAILILNAMLMAVFERIREFGVLKAIGYGPGQVLAMMLLEGFLQATIATLIGGALAVPGMWYLSTHGIDIGAVGGMELAGLTMPAIWKAHYAVETSGVPIFLLFFIVFGAVIFPAIKAARISPVQAMHHH